MKESRRNIVLAFVLFCCFMCGCQSAMKKIVTNELQKIDRLKYGVSTFKDVTNKYGSATSTTRFADGENEVLVAEYTIKNRLILYGFTSENKQEPVLREVKQINDLDWYNGLKYGNKEQYKVMLQKSFAKLFKNTTLPNAQSVNTTQ